MEIAIEGLNVLALHIRNESGHQASYFGISIFFEDSVYCGDMVCCVVMIYSVESDDVNRPGFHGG